MSKKYDRRDMYVKQTKATLDIELNEHELLERGKELATKLHERRQKEEALAAHNKDAKEEIKGLNSDITRLSKVVESGTEERKVECDMLVDLRSNKLWYEKDGKQYNERVCSPEEVERYRQQDIPMAPTIEEAKPEQPNA